MQSSYQEELRELFQRLVFSNSDFFHQFVFGKNVFEDDQI